MAEEVRASYDELQQVAQRFGKAQDQVQKVMQEVKTDRCIPIRGDVFKFVSKSKEQFDFIFADPPYDLRELETLPDLIFQNNLLKEDGLFVLEHGKTSHFEDHPHFIEKRVLKENR